MSVVPEFLLQAAFIRGISRMRTDSRLVAQLFRNLDAQSLAQMVGWLKTQTFDLCINYPRETLKVPAVVILLKAENEFQAFLGDSMGIDTPDMFAFEGPVVTGQVPGVATVSNLSGNAKTVFGPFQAQTGTLNTLRIPTPEWVTDQWITDAAFKCRIIEGTGVGQTCAIIGNSRDTLMVSPDWLVAPDNTTVFQITQEADETVGEPASLYDRNNMPALLERRGGLYEVSYQIQVIGPNPEFTIFLTTIIKGIFTLFRQFLEEQGVINFKLGATDFAPRSEYQPDLSYMRAFNLEFIYPFDVWEPLDGIARSIHLQLEGQADGTVAVQPVLSDTTFDITKGGPVGSPFSDTQRIYFGTATPPGSIDANFVQNVLGGEGTLLASARQRSLNFFNGPGQFMYYAMPSRFSGIPGNFIDAGTGLPIGMSIAATLTLTTAFGSEPFDVWKNDNPSLGAITMSVT